MTDFNLGDIPDLSGLSGSGSSSQPFENGWYKGTILEKREFVDQNGNDRVFESNDTPAQKSGRNIRLQVQLTRQSDNKNLNISYMVNYQPSDLTAQTVQAVAKAQEDRKSGGSEIAAGLFRSIMSLTRLGKLQQVAGVRQLQRTTEGGLDLTPLFGKTAYFRVKEDSRNDKYKEIADLQADAPKKAPVL